MTIYRLCLTGCLLVAMSPAAHADGGTLRFSDRLNGYQVSVFTSPTILRAGQVDISVLVQDERGTRVPDASVQIRAAKRGQLEVTAWRQATAEAATNKLLVAALLEMNEPGRWDVEIQVQGPQGKGQARFDLEIGEPLPHWVEMWPWFSWPAGVVVLFGLHQVLTQRHRRRTASRLGSVHRESISAREV